MNAPTLWDQPTLETRANMREEIKRVMANGNWYSLDEIKAAINHYGDGVSARIRDLRKPRYGGHQVDIRRRSSRPLIYEYRLWLRGKVAA
jgi:hypothetical protein